MSTRFICFFLIVFLVGPSCKKGDDDPWITMRSRTARLAGEWTVKNYKEDVFKDSEDGPEHVIVTGEEFNYTYTSDIAGNSFGNAVREHTYTFEKDGKFEIYLDLFTTLADSTEIYETSSRRGQWEFLGESGDFANKERIVLYSDRLQTASGKRKGNNVYSSSENYKELNPFEEIQVMEIYELRNKKLRMGWEIVNQIDHSPTLTGLLNQRFYKNGRADINLGQ